ncbi:hypothetical protein M408DRAFT_333355 [Serendipita vermifera MAFF 305830]|uniref:Uncharacterized protein n=1 Tax=Serendipita vermifera MAFF 305830 TaxID=933852 RepID=A0A0C2WW79_SERVB|nr:hypothetical protein M408DRAFT_333355 [Serendipita vermifera MAFF 305830]
MQACFRSQFQRLSAPLKSIKSIPKASNNTSYLLARSLSTSTVTAAHTIRSAVLNGDVDRGYQLFTKYYNEEQCSSTVSSGENAGTRQPSRYLAHVLLHALHRGRHPLNAAVFTKMCMERGIKIRGHTFSTVFAGISPPCDYTVPVKRPISTEKLPPIHLLTATLGLLKAARKSGHKQHSWMYDRVINAFLLQGEVLTAAFLFITLVKEWNARRLAKAMDEAQAEVLEDPSPETGGNRPSYASEYRRPVVRPYVVAPQGVWLEKITAAIEEDLYPLSNSAENFPTGKILTALSVLVKLLEDDHSYLPGRWRLLQITRSALLRGNMDDAPYKRFHRILQDLCQRSHPVPGVDLFSYHVLLRYSLRDQKSIELGTNVLRALCESHKPSTVTYNILINELTCLGDAATATAITRLLGAESLFALNKPARDSNGPVAGGSVQWRMVEYLSSHPIPRPDGYTVTTAMSESIARADPHAACRLLSQMFPELHRADFQSSKLSSCKPALLRAASLSPHFWATAQRAATEVKSLTLSTRIWRLVTRAEKIQRSSHTGDMLPSIYNVEAYTCQLQFFLSRLEGLQLSVQTSPEGYDGKCSPQAITAQYSQLLDIMYDVLVTLRDRVTGKARISGFEFDDRIARTLFALVKALLTLENSLSAFLGYKGDSSTQIDSDWADACSQLPRILGTVRKITHHCQVPHPEWVLEVGFASYKDGAISTSSLGEHGASPSVPLVPNGRSRKHRAFKIRYSTNNFRLSGLPKEVVRTGKKDKQDASRAGKRLLRQLEQVSVRC